MSTTIDRSSTLAGYAIPTQPPPRNLDPPLTHRPATLSPTHQTARPSRAHPARSRDGPEVRPDSLRGAPEG
ncbi:hypothetical protein GCM10009733_067520 [Nonomuraea maheshkhaliensis]|uniref:Uncharacterized protein n=1 Tax=Nonomuraea maheshkhaliensis TaxID=419590 RepID=A0ABN2FV39_9ACTN